MLYCVPYMDGAGSFTALSTRSRVKAVPLAVKQVLLRYRSVPVTTSGVAPSTNPVTIVAVVSLAVVAVCYPVVYQGSIFVLTELTD